MPGCRCGRGFRTTMQGAMPHLCSMAILLLPQAHTRRVIKSSSAACGRRAWTPKRLKKSVTEACMYCKGSRMYISVISSITSCTTTRRYETLRTHHACFLQYTSQLDHLTFESNEQSGRVVCWLEVPLLLLRLIRWRCRLAYNSPPPPAEGALLEAPLEGPPEMFPR